MTTIVKDPELQELLERLGALTGEPADQALRRLVAGRVRQLESLSKGSIRSTEEIEQRAVRLAEIGQRCVEAVGNTRPMSKSDLYDDSGLPR